MAVTYTAAEPVDATGVMLRFSSDRTAPVTFRVFKEGVQVAAFVSNDGTGEFLVHVGPDEFPAVFVVDLVGELAPYAFPGRFTLHWKSVSGANSYRVEENISAVWTLRDTVFARGQSYYTWVTRWLEDLTTHQFRIIPLDAAGNQGTALSFSTAMVRHPNVPEVTYSVNGGLNLVITAA